MFLNKLCPAFVERNKSDFNRQSEQNVYVRRILFSKVSSLYGRIIYVRTRSFDSLEYIQIP